MAAAGQFGSKSVRDTVVAAREFGSLIRDQLEMIRDIIQFHLKAPPIMLRNPGLNRQSYRRTF
jgi:hypothetical protein